MRLGPDGASTAGAVSESSPAGALARRFFDAADSPFGFGAAFFFFGFVGFAGFSAAAGSSEGLGPPNFKVSFF